MDGGMSLPKSPVDTARALTEHGRVPEAVLVLTQAAAREDADALMELAWWRMAGQLVPRDLAMARDYFLRAANAGRTDATPICNAFLANGTGATPDWQAAIAMLRGRASSDPDAATQLALIEAMRLKRDGDPERVPAGRALSVSPHVELFSNAFTPAECRFLIAIAEPLMQPAITVNPHTGQRLANPIRTSDAAGFPLVWENPTIHALNRRIAAICRLAVSHGEPLQVLRYSRGQQYRAHNDTLPATDNQRAVTVLIYLNDDYCGGETHFFANDLSIRGGVGDALLFRNVVADGKPDPRATHAGLPVTGGVKFIASRWIREQPLSLAGST